MDMIAPGADKVKYKPIYELLYVYASAPKCSRIQHKFPVIYIVMFLQLIENQTPV